MKFDQIVCLDPPRLTSDGVERLSSLSHAPVLVYSDYATSDEQLIDRIGVADCILFNWKTKLSANVLHACKNLKYISLSCSLYDEKSANVDLSAAKASGISVASVKDYGDEGVVEFILSQLICLYQGFGKWQWQPQPTELGTKTLGVIGLGKTGLMVAEAARFLGMEVLYYSRTRKPEHETPNLSYAPLHELLAKADAITTHLPRNTYLLDQECFDKMKSQSILINISIGPTFEVDAFEAWIRNKNNFAIFDAVGAFGCADSFARHSNVIYLDRASGWTIEAQNRLTEQVYKNLLRFLHSKTNKGIDSHSNNLKTEN